MISKLYRAEDLVQGSGAIDIWLQEHEVLRETPCGYWIASSGKRCEKFVYKHCSRFAFPTIKEALENYELRKIWELRHGINKCRKAKAALDTVRRITADSAAPENYFGLVFKAPTGSPRYEDVVVDVRLTATSAANKAP